jgi:hypothetical protein
MIVQSCECLYTRLPAQVRELRELIIDCCRRAPAERPTFKQVSERLHEVPAHACVCVRMRVRVRVRVIE